jgi:hypothetical protein
MASPPYCNLNLVNDEEYYSYKKEQYNITVANAPKLKKIFQLILGINIFFFIVFGLLALYLYKQNKKFIKNFSPWTTSVVVLIIFSLISCLSMSFSGLKTLFLNQELKNEPKYDDIERPCYSNDKKKIIEADRLMNAPSTDLSSRLNTFSDVKGTNIIKSGTTIMATGLDKLDGIKITTSGNRTSKTTSDNNKSSSGTTDRTQNFGFNQDLTSTKSANASSTSDGDNGPETQTDGYLDTSNTTAGLHTAEYSV